MIKLLNIKLLKDALLRVEVPIQFNAFPLSYMRTECCNVPVGLIEDFWRGGHWVLCSTCKDFKAYVPPSPGASMPYWEWNKVWNGLEIAVKNAGQFLNQLFNAANSVREYNFNENVNELIIGTGSQMVDGVWQPKGLLGAQEDPQSED